MSDDIQNTANKFINQTGSAFEQLSEQLKAKYGPGSMDDTVEQLGEDLETIFTEEPAKKVVISRDVDPLLYAASAVGTLWWQVRKFKKTYKQIDEVRKLNTLFLPFHG